MRPLKKSLFLLNHPSTDSLIGVKSKNERFFSELLLTHPHNVFDEIAHTCPTVSCFQQLGSHIICSVDLLSSTRSCFYLVLFSHCFDHSELIFFRFRFFRRSSLWLSHGLYFQLFHQLSILFTHVNLICINSGWKENETLSVKFYLKGQIGGLIIRIPTVVVYEGVSFHNASTNLGTELGRSLGFTHTE